MSAPGTRPTPIETLTVRSLPPSGLWKPVVGSELTALLSRKALSEGDSRGVEQETCRILSKCVPPVNGGQEPPDSGVGPRF
jgi:hypothetical protein